MLLLFPLLDIAVGAPYEGSGRVYLYCGSSNGINTKEAQVGMQIWKPGRDMCAEREICMFSFLQVLSSRSRSVTLFGYSLSGNLDVDDNLYPDLAVGCLSDSVFVYRYSKLKHVEMKTIEMRLSACFLRSRARPVVRVSSTLRVTPDKIDITKEQCDKRTWYAIKRK